MGDKLPAPTVLFRKVYSNANRIRQSGRVPAQEFTRYIYHQIGRLEGMLVARGKWYHAEVMQEFIDFQKRMENLLPKQNGKV
jgi:hypothetical protein